MSSYRRRGVSGTGLFGNPNAVLYSTDAGINYTRNAGNQKATTHPYHGKREAERAAKRLAKAKEVELAAMEDRLHDIATASSREGTS